MIKPIAVVIASGAYVVSEIAAEFGRLPPSFLPIGNRRLYQWQVETLRAVLPDATIYLSVPGDFALPAHDKVILTELDVSVVHTPAHLSLGASLAYVVLSAGLTGHRLRILHGDTLLQDYPFADPDCLSVGIANTYYSWADVQTENGAVVGFPSQEALEDSPTREVVTGAFAFDDAALFLRCLVRQDNGFIQALDLYARERGLKSNRSDHWLDFGHLHTYFHSRRRITSEREFNRLETEADFFIKSSSKVTKIAAERAWYRALPDELRMYTPLVMDATPAGPSVGAYKIEYLYLAPLSDLFVFGDLPVPVWRSVFEACDGFLSTASTIRPSAPAQTQWADMYGPKSLARIETYCRASGVDPDREWKVNGAHAPSLTRIVESVSALIPAPTDVDISLVHGDFCFSNILFDFRTQRIKTIDPRGLDSSDRITPFGDRRYELGKLFHSAVGLYDYIIAGFYQVRRTGREAVELEIPDNARLRAIREMFVQQSFARRTPYDSHAHEIAILLFLSMLPLHADNPSRQTALLANGLRLWRMLDNGSLA